MNRKVSIVLPLPPRALSPNRVGHEHWRKRSSASKEYRHIAAVFARRAGIRDSKFPVPVRINAAFFCGPTPPTDGPRYRPLDAGNAIGSLKSAIDGFVDAGLVPDDSHTWVRFGSIEIFRSKSEHRGHACVMIEIEFMGDSQSNVDPCDQLGFKE